MMGGRVIIYIYIYIYTHIYIYIAIDIDRVWDRAVSSDHIAGTPELLFGSSGSPWKVDAFLAVDCGGLLMTQQVPPLMLSLPTRTFATAGADMIYNLQARRTLRVQAFWGEVIFRRATR